jgi:hypothetical protein
MTATNVNAIESGSLEVGRVISTTFGVLARQWPMLLVLGLPFIALPDVLATFARPEDAGLARLLANVPSIVFVGAATPLAYCDLRGLPKRGVGELVGRGFGKFGSLWLIYVITGLASVFGFVLLILPGLMITAIWIPASAACVVEDLNSSRALERAWRLSKGSRWRLLGLLAVGAGACALVVILLLIVASLAVLPLGEARAMAVYQYALLPLAGICVWAIAAVGGVAAYVGLVRVLEGETGLEETFA